MKLDKLMKNRKLLLILILILAIGLRFYNITEIGIDQWDEGEYLDAAESFLEGKWQWLGIGLKPLHNAGLVMGILLFGNYDYSGFIVTAALGVLTVLIVYFLGKEFFDEKTGLLAAFILAIMEYHIYFSRALFSDVTSTFFVSMTILLYFISVKKASKMFALLAGIFASLCFLVRINAIAVVFIILFAELIFAIRDKAFFDKKIFKERFARFLIIFSVVCVFCFSVFNAYLFFAPSNLVEVQFGINTGQAGLSLDYGTFYLEQLVILGSPILLLAFLLGVFKGFESRKNGDIILLIWSLSILIFFSLYGFKRYRIFMMALPAIAILASRGLFMLKNINFKKIGNKLFLVAVLLLAITSLYASYDTVASSSTAYRDAAEFVRLDGGQGVIVSQLGIFQYYSNEKPLPVVFFDNLNNSEIKLEKLYNEGYSHLILDYRALQYNELAHKIVNSFEPAKKIDNTATLFDPAIANPGLIEDFEEMRKNEIYHYVYVYRLADLMESI
ncbi:MAG: glycosyltransferase family 39 protein [Nanoarchaeota archaeon]|nr:glycosyltransferase family 39 protein [Nanoarchaeota archaeon]